MSEISSNTQQPSLVSGAAIHYQQRAATEGRAGLHWAIGPEGTGVLSGWAEWDNAVAPPKTLDYHEVLLILEGRFGVRFEDGTALEGQAGDVLHLPKGSTVNYFGENAKVFFAITPPGKD